jgi:outer membrane protein TolC
MFAAPTWAKDSPQPLKLNLHQLEGLLLGRNNSLEALYCRLEQAVHQLQEDSYRQWPSLRVSYSYYPQDQLVEEDGVSFYEQRGEMALVYPVTEALLNRRYSQQEKQMTVEERQVLLEAGRLELLRQLRRQYAAVLKEKRLLDEYHRRGEELSRWLAEAKQTYYHKQSPLPDVLNLETQQLDNQQLLEQHRRDYSLKLAKLAYLAGLENRNWEPVPPLAPPPLPDKQALLGLLNQHPLIRACRLKASREGAKLEGDWLKSFKLETMVGYIVEEDRYSAYQSGAHLGLRFSVPLAYKQLADYRQLSLLDEQQRWQAEAEAQEQELRHQLAAAYILLEGIGGQRELAQRQIQQAQEKVNFLQTQMEYPLAEPSRPWQRLLSAYQQQWRAREKLIELEHQWYTAYYELLYLSGRTDPPGSAAGVSLTYSLPMDNPLYPAPPQAVYIKQVASLSAPDEQRFLIQFCRAKGINQVLLNAGPLFAPSPAPEWLPVFISRLKRQGISVWAIAAPAAEASRSIPAISAPLLSYNRQHLSSEALDGLLLHLALPDKPEENPERFKAELNQLLSLCGRLGRQLRASPRPLKLGLGITYWYDQLDMQLLADSIYYADELIVTLPEGLEVAELLKEVKDELRLGEEMGRRVLLALDCSRFSPDGHPGLGEYMEQLQSQWPQRLGFVIFDYQTYRTLEEGEVAP